jgi:phosphate-selective porin OprO/OprP
MRITVVLNSAGKEVMYLRILMMMSVCIGYVLPVYASDSADISARIELLEKELKELKALQQQQAAQAKTAAQVQLTQKGLQITSPDASYRMSLRGYMQVDYRAFLNDDAHTGKEEFLARRLRPILEVKAGDASFRLMPDFSGTATKLFDAHADYAWSDALNFRVGKFKSPIGLERLQSAADIMFVERGLPTNLAPSRDIGAMVYGELLPKTMEYQLGVFNGNPDGSSADSDEDDHKDMVARVFAYPVTGLGVGVAGSYGQRDGSMSKPMLGTYKTVGQQDFFKYRSDSYADGVQWRVFPQAYWYVGNKGVLAEYALSHQEVTCAVQHEGLNHSAWQVAASYVLTGEDVNFKGGVKPAHDFSPHGDGWGAWELTARVGQMRIDDAAFTTFADALVSAQDVAMVGVGMNWWMSENLQLMSDYSFTAFDGGGSAGGDRADEHALFSRVQFRF